jgi:hypothetical protein
MEALTHELAEIPAGSDEERYVGGPLGEGLPAGSAGQFGQGVQKIIFALKVANHRALEFRFEATSQTDEEGG